MKQRQEMSEREYFAFIGRRPGMFVGKASFHMAAAFLAGYEGHAGRHGGPSLLTGLDEWLVARRGRDPQRPPGQGEVTSMSSLQEQTSGQER
ncbi:hypothetical protein ACFXKJ_30200 [Kitasatospora indigofera]|uniref:hypothetical protein n=1 Tax=Kitasatospora indigofera TaxID=67307 RepID=UPI0036A3BCD4